MSAKNINGKQRRQLRRISYSSHWLPLFQSSTAVSACAIIRVNEKPSAAPAFKPSWMTRAWRLC
jgi:hypothetical protein